MLNFYAKCLKNVKNVKKTLRFYDKYLKKHKKHQIFDIFKKRTTLNSYAGKKIGRVTHLVL